MVSDQAFSQLQAQVARLQAQLTLKVLGNDPSTNLGLSSQSINFGGPTQAGSLTLQLNGVETSINNSIDPDLGETVSLESKDLTVTNGDKLVIAPDAMFILVYDVTIPGYKVVASIAADTGSGNITLAALGNSKQVILDASTPQTQVTDGVHTSTMTPTGIIVGNAIGLAGTYSLTAGGHTLTFTNGILTAFV